MTGAEREYEVLPGNDQDKCPLCGIVRISAGWIKVTCGPDFREPGCFVAPESEAGSHD